MVQEHIKQGLLVAPYGFKKTAIDYVILSLDRPEKDSNMNTFIDWLKSELGLPQA